MPGWASKMSDGQPDEHQGETEGSLATRTPPLQGVGQQQHPADAEQSGGIDSHDPDDVEREQDSEGDGERGPLVAIPILMIVLSMTLPAPVNRATNLVVATLYIPVSIYNAAGELWT